MGFMADDTPGKLESKALLACLEVGKRLTSSLNLNEILQLIMEKVSALVAAEHWSLLLRDEDTGSLSFKIVVGVEKEKLSHIRIDRGMGIAGYVAENQEAVFVANVREDPRFFPEVDEITGFETRSIFCFPLCIHGKALGVIEILNLRDVQAFETHHLPILTLLADYAAIAIRNAQFLEHIRHLSITDEYTGLYNARYMHEILEKMIQHAAQKGEKLAVAFMDMDHFKGVVDTYGHLMGSRVLREVGQTLREVLNPTDLPAKYGGDEYILIMPGCDRKTAEIKLNRVLEAIRNTPYLQPEASPPLRVSASIGFAIYPDDASSKKDLLLMADQAMYRVKKHYKNAVNSWAERI